jgi:Asp-tRNA(Asn)/Glu-tRNA(Gln) amidotransferase B subunit
MSAEAYESGRRKGPALVANLMLNGLMPQLKRAGMTIEQSPVSPSDLAFLAQGIESGLIDFSHAKKLIRERFE